MSILHQVAELEDAADPLTPELWVRHRCTLCDGLADWRSDPCTPDCKRRTMTRDDRPGRYVILVVTREDGSALSPNEAARVSMILTRTSAPPQEGNA